MKTSKRKRKVMVGNEYKEVAQEEIPAEDIPPRFKAFVQDAIEAYNRRSNINFVKIVTSAHSWKTQTGRSTRIQ